MNKEPEQEILDISRMNVNEKQLNDILYEMWATESLPLYIKLNKKQYGTAVPRPFNRRIIRRATSREIHEATGISMKQARAVSINFVVSVFRKEYDEDLPTRYASDFGYMKLIWV